MNRPGAAFKLTKWYLDCVDAEGRVGIAYWAAVSWHGVTVPWQRATVYSPSVDEGSLAGRSSRRANARDTAARVRSPMRNATARSPRTYTSLRATPPPAFVGEKLHWLASSASCEVEYERTVPPVTLRLLDGEHGTIDWQCEAPGARARFAVGGSRALEGTGYAERIEITMPPWHLPIDELRWGRWISDEAQHSVVWIDWRGPETRTWVLVDGRLVEGATVRDDGVSVPGGELALSGIRVLHEESVNSVVNAVPGLAHLARRIGLAMRDHKWRARGTWVARGDSPTPGWAVHEIVWMR